MDRPEPGLIKWSPKPGDDSFIHLNLQRREIHLYEPTGFAQRGRFDYSKVSQHEGFPPLTTYDWSPSIPGLVAVGNQNGFVNLLRIDDESNEYVELPLKLSRACQSVAFSTEHKLAVGLDRVRNDRCLQIWDVARLKGPGTPPSLDLSVAKNHPFTEPTEVREPSVSVSSIRFFEDNPNTLVVGIKGQGLRIHDLRDHSQSVISFQTKCNNNLSIDYADQNYFASSALDLPGVMVWDRRATSRPVASPSYLDAVDVDDLPWGGALRLDRAVDSGSDLPELGDKNSMIRSLRYCRNHRGMLAVLSKTGQLKLYDTITETTHPDFEAEGSPELLNVRRSSEMDTRYVEQGRKNDRIVSFDWVTLDSPVMRPRVLVLRANGAFEILEKPSYTASYPYKLVPWKAPHRGFEESSPYHEVIRLEPTQASELLGPLVVENALSDIPIFGTGKSDVPSTLQQALDPHLQDAEIVEDESAERISLPASFAEATTVGSMLQVLRQISPRKADKSSTTKAKQLATHQERHEKLLMSTLDTHQYPREAQTVLDHVMLLRAKERYLFDCEVNRNVVSDDPWLRDVWTWVAGAEEAVTDGGMMSHPLDLGYMGVATIWDDDLGANKSARLSEGASVPDAAAWERCINAICKKRGVPRFDAVETRKPHHRQLCLDMCGLGRSESIDISDFEKTPVKDRRTTYHTMAAAHALFRGDTSVAVQKLKAASTEHPELLFVSLALQLIGNGNSGSANKQQQQLDFDENVASKTDPYLRAISSLIATGDWATIANQKSLPLRERVYVAVRYFDDAQLTSWLKEQVATAISTGDIEAIILTGITDALVDILARYVDKFHDVQTATLLMSFCAPRYIDDHRCTAWRNAYRAYLQRHRAFFQRTKFEVESTKRSKLPDGRPVIKPPFRQVALRCVYCDTETRLATAGGVSTAHHQLPPPGSEKSHQLASKLAVAGVSCPNCKRHLPRCVVCLEIVGAPRSDRPEASTDPATRLAARFPTFCLGCEHVLHLDHARQWFARHVECPVPECRCRCNFRANPELNYQ